MLQQCTSAVVSWSLCAETKLSPCSYLLLIAPRMAGGSLSLVLEEMEILLVGIHGFFCRRGFFPPMLSDHHSRGNKCAVAEKVRFLNIGCICSRQAIYPKIGM